MKKITFLIAALFVVTQSFAGFPVGRGRFMLVPSYNLYTAKGYWNSSRAYNAYGNNGRFSSNYFGLYGGIGINRNLDFVFNIPFVIQTYQETGKLSSNAGIGDLSLGLSFFLGHFNERTHLSVTTSLMLPGYQNGITPFIGFQKPAVEIKFGVAGTAEYSLRNPYFDIEAGVRHFFDEFGPTQLFTNITGGLPINDEFKLSGTIGGVSSISPLAQFDIQNLSYNRQFDYIRITGSAGYTLSKTVSLWANLYTDVTGSSIGRGSGLSIFGVIKF